jgi:hypothetical protein
MIRTHYQHVLYIIMNLTQLERIKTELKDAFYEQKKMIRT